MPSQTRARGPGADLDEQLRELVAQHREIAGEPLHLALRFTSGCDTPDLFLLEVIGGFGDEIVDVNREIFQVAFGPSPGLTLDRDQFLRLLLTNPTEVETAIRECWDSIMDVQRAVEAGHFDLLWADERGEQLLEQLRG